MVAFGEARDVRGAWRVLVLLLPLTAVGAGIGWVYAHPPLQSTGVNWRQVKGRTLAYGIDVQNAGHWPLTLTRVCVNGQDWEYPKAMAVSNFADAQLAGNAAIGIEVNGHKLKTEPVTGWELQPEQRVRGVGSYALRLDWDGMPSAETEIMVHYRYLGLPMKHSVTSRWAIPN